MCVASPRCIDHEVVCVIEEKQAVTSSLEQRAQLIAVKKANDDLSNDFTGTEGVAKNALIGGRLVALELAQAMIPGPEK